MKFAEAVIDVYKRKWSYINNFTVQLSFPTKIAKTIGWTDEDSKKICLNIKNISTPQFSNSPIDIFTGDQWRFHVGRDELYMFSITFKDEDLMKYYRKFLLAYFLQKKMYFDDAKMSVQIFKDADYLSEVVDRDSNKGVLLFDFQDCLINSVSKLDFNNETESQIAEFDVEFKCKIPEFKINVN